MNDNDIAIMKYVFHVQKRTIHIRIIEKNLSIVELNI
jgi:hypothetical protein